MRAAAVHALALAIGGLYALLVPAPSGDMKATWTRSGEEVGLVRAFTLTITASRLTPLRILRLSPNCTCVTVVSPQVQRQLTPGECAQYQVLVNLGEMHDTAPAVWMQSSARNCSLCELSIPSTLLSVHAHER